MFYFDDCFTTIIRSFLKRDTASSIDSKLNIAEHKHVWYLSFTFKTGKGVVIESLALQSINATLKISSNPLVLQFYNVMRRLPVVVIIFMMFVKLTFLYAQMNHHT